MKKFRIELRWAFVITLFTVVWMMIEQALGWHEVDTIGKQPIYNFAMYLPLFVLYFFALREKKNKVFNGVMSWQQGFIACIVLGFIVAIFAPLAQYAIHTYVTPAYFENAQTYAMSVANYTQDQATARFNLTAAILSSVGESIGVGVIYGLILASVLKSEN